MRVTTNMLNAQMSKAGLPTGPSTLFDYMDKGGSGNGLLDALQSKSDSAINALNKGKYEKLGKASDLLSTQVQKFTKKDADSLMEKAKASGDYSEVYEELYSLVDSYNDTLASLDKTAEGLNAFYRQSLVDICKDNKEALGNIGITQNKDGSLVLDKEKLKAAEPAALEKALCGDDGMAAHLAFVAGRIADNAQTNVESASNVYGGNGSLLNAYQNKYNFWG